MQITETVTNIDVAPIAHRAPAKGRILDTANTLFYENGIRNVGVDRLIAASSVTKATFYKHYRAKDNLILEYITRRHVSVRTELESIIEAAPDPETALTNFITAITAEIGTPGFRGCPFINAAAEYPQADHPVRKIITAHRDWYVEVITQLLKLMGHPVPADAADELLLGRDGAFSGGYAGDSIAATAALGRIASRVLAESAQEPSVKE
ncbi:MAG: TetR/AcrR family transcriptional regulator [Rhodoglobus sp.]